MGSDGSGSGSEPEDEPPPLPDPDEPPPPVVVGTTEFAVALDPEPVPDTAGVLGDPIEPDPVPVLMVLKPPDGDELSESAALLDADFVAVPDAVPVCVPPPLAPVTVAVDPFSVPVVFEPLVCVAKDDAVATSGSCPDDIVVASGLAVKIPSVAAAMLRIPLATLFKEPRGFGRGRSRGFRGVACTVNGVRERSNMISTGSIFSFGHCLMFVEAGTCLRYTRAIEM